jgi:dihydroorotase
MNLLIKSATIIDSKSPFHNKTQDILVESGKITKIAGRIKNSKKYKELRLANLHLSQGWFDSSVSFGEPGYEERGTIDNGLSTSARSGFTAVALNPNTNPVLSTNTDIAFVKSKAHKSGVNIYPIGALTQHSEGEHLAELFDMHNAGAVAFGDYQRPIKDPNLMKIALLYAGNFGGLVYSFPQDNDIARQGVMNENITSTMIGLKGIPAMSEELQIVRDLFLLEYTQGRLHIPTISTAKSVELIREAKKNKLDVSCSVAIHNLFFTDEALNDFDTNFKVIPPLRTREDIDALKAGLRDGTIDMVTSDHNPLDIELKKVEFDYAMNGTIGLESAFGALNSLFPFRTAINLLTRGKERFGVESTSIDMGNELDATLFDPSTKYEFKADHIFSKSSNSIFLGTELKGKVYGIFNDKRLILNA